MRRRTNPAYIPPAITIAFGSPDPSPFAPLHRRIGIETHVHRQAVTDYHGGFDRESGQYWSPHQFREFITLAGAA